jgi:hypothetical protein
MKKVPNCKVCADRESCTSPCEALKGALKKVTSGRGELPIGVPSYIKNEWPNPAIAGKKLSIGRQRVRIKDHMLVTFVKLGFKREIIAEILNIAPKNLRYRLRDAKKRLNLT